MPKIYATFSEKTINRYGRIDGMNPLRSPTRVMKGSFFCFVIVFGIACFWFCPTRKMGRALAKPIKNGGTMLWLLADGWNDTPSWCGWSFGMGVMGFGSRLYPSYAYFR